LSASLSPSQGRILRPHWFLSANTETEGPSTFHGTERRWFVVGDVASEGGRHLPLTSQDPSVGPKGKAGKEPVMISAPRCSARENEIKLTPPWLAKEGEPLPDPKPPPTWRGFMDRLTKTHQSGGTSQREGRPRGGGGYGHLVVQETHLTGLLIKLADCLSPRKE